MKHLQIFEDFSSTLNPKIKEITDMLGKATKNFTWSDYSNWDEDMIKDAFLMIKTKPEFMAVNAELKKSPGQTLFKSLPQGPNFDWLFEIFVECFRNGSDLPTGREILDHLVKSKIVDLYSPIEKGRDMSPFLKKLNCWVTNGDWSYVETI